jgi:hypothetical protein
MCAITDFQWPPQALSSKDKWVGKMRGNLSCSTQRHGPKNHGPVFRVGCKSPVGGGGEWGTRGRGKGELQTATKVAIRLRLWG